MRWAIKDFIERKWTYDLKWYLTVPPAYIFGGIEKGSGGYYVYMGEQTTFGDNPHENSWDAFSIELTPMVPEMKQIIERKCINTKDIIENLFRINK